MRQSGELKLTENYCSSVRKAQTSSVFSKDFFQMAAVILKLIAIG